MLRILPSCRRMRASPPPQKKNHYYRITKLHSVTYQEEAIFLVGFLKWKNWEGLEFYIYAKFHMPALYRPEDSD